MYTIRDRRDYEQFGLVPLTGESCVYGMRYLFDLTSPGRELVRQFLGMQGNTCFGESWNSRGVASVMLPWSWLPELAAFALLQKPDVTYVVMFPHLVVGMTAEYEERLAGEIPADFHPDESKLFRTRMAALGKLDDNYGPHIRTYSPLNVPQQGGRAVHQMTGRTA